MDLQRQRIAEDLRGVVNGEVLCDAASRALYATDASLFEIWPLAVVRPRSTADVAATVRWAAENGVPVHARGAGSSLCGDALGPGVVIDCSSHLRRIVATGADTVRVQAGVVAGQLEEHLARVGRCFGPDPPNVWVTTVGGMIGRDISGSRLLRHGSVRGRIRAAEVVLADGSVVELTAVPEAEAAAPQAEVGGDRVVALAGGMASLLAAAQGVIRRDQPAGRRSHGGYRLADLRHDGVIDLPRLLCGAEGTLGIVTEATLATVPADAASAVALLLFDSLDAAARAALRLAGRGPSACDLFDKRHLALARDARVAFELLIPPVADAGLLVEFVGADAAAASSRLEEAIRLVSGSRRLCIDVRRAEDAADVALFWDLSRQVVSTLHGVRGEERPVPFIEDIVVPPEALPEFLRRLQAVLKQQSATAMLFGHAAHGQLHVRPYVDPAAPERLVPLAEAVYAEVFALGGTLGGEQGLGLSRTRFFRRGFPELSAVFDQVRTLFDPQGIMNPGRLSGPVGESFPFRTLPGLSPSANGPGPTDTRLPVLSWPAGGFLAEVDACNGCGGCRSQSALVRMCPRYRENPGEESAPRAKASLLAAIATGRIDARAVAGEAVAAVADTCFNCHQCRLDCAAGVDIPALVTEIRAAHVAANGLGATDWLLSRIDGVSALGGRFPALTNALLESPRARWVLEKVFGLAQGRRLPRCTGNRTLRWATRRGLTRPSQRGGPRVLYFLDTFARRHDPELAEAFVALLERSGVGVYIDPRQVSAGMPLVSAGDVAAARRLASRNLRILAEAVRLGYRIVCTEPAAVTCIRHDYPRLIDDEDMGRVVDATCDAATFLWELHRDGRLPSPVRPLRDRVLYHAPCHVRVAGGTSPAEQLLRLIPGITVDATDRGCSGMAGTFGLARRHYRSSLRIGRPLMTAVRSGAVDYGATDCSACRIQMEQGTSKPTVHPVKLLARACGVLPERKAAGGAGGRPPGQPVSG
jgi:FAD/FMN-containing dehydrogenase/Fe-S oxidoreductase